jgi:hypothetical protein
MQAMGQARPLQMPLVKFLLPEAVAKFLLGPEVTSADAGNGPDKTTPNAIRENSFQCKKGLKESGSKLLLYSVLRGKNCNTFLTIY